MTWSAQHRSPLSFLQISMLVLAVLIMPRMAHACNVPVFRYALERWQPDPYELFIFHDGPLAAEAKKLVAVLQEYVDRPDGCPANVGLTLVDVKKTLDKKLAALMPDWAKVVLPWVVLRYPDAAQIKSTLYEGPLDVAAVQKLLDSPLRRVLADKLLRGETAVWILVESGDKAKDDEKAEYVRSLLTKFEKTLKLPELTDTPKDRLRIDAPLKIEFSLLRLARNDAAESFLVRMLLGMEDDLAQRTEPIVFPVFGRGMALWAIVGKGITEANIRSAAQFLVGPCSCEIKAQNPGVDLLLTANWEERLTGRLTSAPELPPLTSLLSEAPAAASPSVSAAPAPATEAVSRPVNYVYWRNIILALGGILIILVLGSVSLVARRK